MEKYSAFSLFLSSKVLSKKPQQIFLLPSAFDYYWSPYKKGRKKILGWVWQKWKKKSGEGVGGGEKL